MKIPKTMVPILLPLTLLLSDAVLAQTSSITEVPADDKSVEYLRYIFGSTVHIITGGTGPSSPDSILGAMSLILNTGMLIFTGLIVGYIFVTGILNSAHEGVSLGKQYSSMWIPLRIIVALSLVLPFSGGYSVMQIGVLWLAGHGVGLANTTWNAALDHMASTGTLYPAQISVDYEGTAMRVLESRVCMHGINTADRHVNVVDEPIEIVEGVSPTDMRSSGVTSSIEIAPQHIVMQRYVSRYGLVSAAGAYTAAWLSDFSGGVPRNYGTNPCGSIKLEFAEIDEGTAIESAIINFQTKIIAIYADLDADLDSLSRQIVLKAVNENADDPDSLAYNNAVKQFQVEYEKAVNEAMSEIATLRINKFANANPDVAGTTVGARDAGWITVGAWYWDLQRINAETQKMTAVEAELTGPTTRAIEHDDYLIFTNALGSYQQKMVVTNSNGEAVNAMERSSYAENSDSLHFVMDRTESVLNFALSEPDPISGMANIGHAIIGSFEIALAGAFLTDLAACVADDTSEAVGGLVGGAARPATSTLCRITNRTLWSLVGAGMLLIPIALLLAFYIPAMPMILWIMGVAAWFVLLIEAVIAGPVWAASHVFPEGNGFIGERAKAGYMVALSLFLRPTLAIFGFIAGMLLVIVLAKVFMIIFLPAMSGMLASSLSGVVTLFAMLAIFTAIMIQIAHRSFGLIHEIPDRVLRYIGGGQENLGEANQEQHGRSIFVGGAAKVVSGASHSMRDQTRSGTKGVFDAAGGGVKNTAGAAKTGMSKMTKMSKMLSPT